MPDLEVVRVGDPGRFPLALVAGVVDHRGEPLALDKRVKSQDDTFMKLDVIVPLVADPTQGSWQWSQ